MPKFMILADSDGNPRSFPPAEVFELEETYPYLIREHFKDSVFWQLCYGNLTTMKLVSQPIGYLTHWKPDVIIVQSGIADCRPEGFTDFQKEIITRSTWKFFKWIRKYVEHPGWIKRRQIYRVSKSSFRKTLKVFKRVFPESKIFWLEIGTGPKYEQFRPGIERRLVEFNDIIKEVYGNDFVPVRERLLAVDGYNAIDQGHLNKKGHKELADILVERINEYFAQKEKVFDEQK